VIEDSYIVNGLQTSQEIFDYFRGKPSELTEDDRTALIRIIASTNSETQDSIIRATNSQTGMGPASLWATDPIHRDLEKLFPSAGLFYDRRKNYWRNRDVPLAKIVSIQDLAQSIISMVLRAPDDARARPSKYFKQKNRSLYQKVFAGWYPIDLYTACAVTRKRAEAYLRMVESDSRHRNNLLFYVLLAAGCLATRSAAPQPKTLAKKLTAKPVDDALLKEALDIARPLYDSLGADDKAAKGPELVKLVNEAIETKFPRRGKKA
jgi:AIPR protein